MAIRQLLLNILAGSMWRGGNYRNNSKDGLIRHNRKLFYEIR
jgi:hypothetical protein